MKKSTLVVWLLAAALGGYVYYTEFRHPTEKPAEGAPKPLYTFSSDDITSIRVSRPGENAPVVLERREEGWVLTSPVATRADRTNVESLTSSLAHVASSRTLPADAARTKEFGLDPPAASVEIHLKKGETQKLELGAKDFTGMDVYARRGGAKDILLVPDAVLTEATRPVIELRDRAVLDLSAWAIAELDIRTPKTKLQLEKKGNDWNMSEPRPWPADSDEAGSLSNSLSSARFTDVVEEQAKDAATGARYGLNSPQVTVHVRNEQGSEATLLVGKKDENKYFARDAGRLLVFHVEEALVKKFLDASFESLRDKHVLRSTANDFSQLTIRNEKQTMKASLSADGKWQVEEPAALKGKTMAVWHVFDPLNSSKATEVMDHPPAKILSKLDKPAVEIKLTDKKGAVTTVMVSAKDGNAVYARSSASPAVFKMDPYFLEQLNFLGSQAAP
jgi:uncharacterized protein DUF4340